MILPVPVFPPVPNESPGARIWRIATSYAGCVPLGPHPVRRSDLAALVGRGVNDEMWVAVMSNCATFALGALAAAGVHHERLSHATAIGMAFSDMVQIGIDFGAWRAPADSGPPPLGALCWYRVAGTNDDHVEVCGPGDDEHCGGGRPLNAVTHDVGPVIESCGRPLYKWLDPDVTRATAPTDPAPAA